MTTCVGDGPGRASVDGLLLLNKPAGITSNQARQKVKKLLTLGEAIELLTDNMKARGKRTASVNYDNGAMLLATLSFALLLR